MSTTPDKRPILYVWPGSWGLPSIFPECLAAVIYAQLNIPGEYVLQECVNPDMSPSGQLPFLSDGEGATVVATFSSIAKYIDGLKRQPLIEDEYEYGYDGDVEGQLSEEERRARMQEPAWLAFVQAHLGDLVSCIYFAQKANYNTLVHPTIASAFPLPQRYFVVDRIREMHRPRLEAAGLWALETEEPTAAERRVNPNSVTFRDAFRQEKLTAKARQSLGILDRLLGEKEYFSSTAKPSLLDASVASYVLLLTSPPFRNDTLKTFLANSYPALVAHAQRIQGLAVDAAPVITNSPQCFSWRTLLPIPAESDAASKKAASSKREKTEEEKLFERRRWQWIALALGSVVGWAWAVGLRIQIWPADDEEEDVMEEDGYDEEDEEEDEEE